MVSQVLRANATVLRRLTSVPMASVCISTITEGELLFGLARRPEATRLRDLVDAFLLRTDVLPWDRDCAASYGQLRSAMAANGKTLSPLDLLIAAHAQAVDAVLVSNDQAFAQWPGLTLQDWTQ